MISLRTLLVESSEDEAQLVVRKLRTEGLDLEYERVETNDAIAAALGAGEWDLVLCKVGDPAFDPVRAVRELRDSGRDTCFIAISPELKGDVHAELFNAGACDCVLKQDLARLAPAIKRDLEVAEARRARLDAEARLRHCEARFRSVFETAPHGMALVAPDGRWLAVNQAFCDIVGYGRDELLQITIDAITHPEDLKAEPAFVRRILVDDLAAQDIEKRFLRKDWQTVRCLLSASVLRDGQGEPLKIVLHVSDLGDRTRAEDLRERDEQLRLIVDNLPILIGYVDTNLRYRFINKTGTSWYRRQKGEIIGKTIREVLSSETYDQFLPYLRGALSGELLRFENRITYPDGRVRDVEATYIPHMSSAGTQLGMGFMLVDVTARKAAEAALTESEARFRSLLDNSPSVVLLKDLEGRYLVVSKSFEEWYGHSPEAVVGQTSHDLWPPDLAEEMVRLDRQVADLGEPVSREFDVPFVDGRSHRVIITKFPVTDSTGQLLGIGSLNTDVTESRTIQAQLHQAQKMESVGQLAGGMAHDFNNLLAIILGNLQLLQRSTKEDERSQKRVGNALGATQKGIELTKRLLAFSRRQPLETKSVDVNELVNGMQDLLRRTVREAIDLQLVLERNLWFTKADPNELESALLNLTVNARDAMLKGGEVTISTDNAHFDQAYADQHPELEPGDYVMVAVTDNGPGMPPEVCERAFEPFYTTKAGDKGTGLGLSMVYGFVKQSGGHVSLYSEEGYGTSVKLYLPRAGEARDQAAWREGGDVELPTGHERVLVVEDEPQVREVAVAILEDLGYRVLEAEDGPAALALLDRHDSVDLLFTDVIMPGGMFGTDLADAVKSTYPNTRILMTSGFVGKAAVDSGALKARYAWLDKPYHDTKLAQMVRGVLDGGNEIVA